MKKNRSHDGSKKWSGLIYLHEQHLSNETLLADSKRSLRLEAKASQRTRTVSPVDAPCLSERGGAELVSKGIPIGPPSVLDAGILREGFDRNPKGQII